MEYVAEKREIISVWEIYSVCVCVWSALRQAWISDWVSFHVHTNAAGAHTRASLRLWRQQMQSSDGGQVCSMSLSLSLSVGPGAGHCKGQHASDGKGQ